MYLIPKLVAYNYDTTEFPSIQVRNIGESKDLQLWASAVANLIAKRAITVDMETEQWIRKTIDAPSFKGNDKERERLLSLQQKAGGFPGRPEETGNLGKADAEA